MFAAATTVDSNYNRISLPTLFCFTENFRIHGHNTRQTKHLHADPKKNQRWVKDPLNFKWKILWNDLPSSIRIYWGKYTFQRNLKLYLFFEKYWYLINGWSMQSSFLGRGRAGGGWRFYLFSYFLIFVMFLSFSRALEKVWCHNN